jgi:hypothetical protein
LWRRNQSARRKKNLIRGEESNFGRQSNIECMEAQCGALDECHGKVSLGFIGRLHRAINLAVAIALVALGHGGFVYFYLIAATWNRGLALGAGVVAAAGVYWL